MRVSFVVVMFLFGCAPGPERVSPVPPLPAPEEDSNQTIVVSITTSQGEASGGGSGLQATLKATPQGESPVGGEVKLGVNGQGSQFGEAKTLQIDRTTWIQIISNPDVWSVTFEDGEWKLRNKRPEPKPSSSLPLSAKEEVRFSGSRSAKIDVTLDKGGNLSGTLILENDAVLVGFGAHAEVDLIDKDGKLIETVHIARKEIPGKPPGRAIQRRFSFSTMVRNSLALSSVHTIRVRLLGG